MPDLHERFQKADWKAEKPAPVIDCPDAVAAGAPFEVEVCVGTEIAHPNTTEHHIRWFALYFQADGAKFPAEVAKFDFTAHGESTEGPNKGPVYADPFTSVRIKIDKPGTLLAASYCNIHGLWESSKAIKLA